VGSFKGATFKEAIGAMNNHEIATNGRAGEQTTGRPVQIVSIGFAPKTQDFNKIIRLVEQEAALGADIIILPETWRSQNNEPETLDGQIVNTLSEVARRYNTYIVCPFDRKDSSLRLNTAVLLDRQGKIASLYDKVYPYWSEYDLDPPVNAGTQVPVVQTDFGCVGMAICFDVNFPEVWQQLADQDAEVVLWPSAYSAGRSLQAHAINHHFYIVTATYTPDCIVYDINGDEILYEKGEEINVSRVTIDLDRGIYHENFNVDKLKKLLAERGNDVEVEQWLTREQWFVLKAKRPGVSARELARHYGLEELRSYLSRSRREIDKMRGEGVTSGDTARELARA
jgi:predicted amidohydrolase